MKNLLHGSTIKDQHEFVILIQISAPQLRFDDASIKAKP